jgi:hypothetical protein
MRSFDVAGCADGSYVSWSSAALATAPGGGLISRTIATQQTVRTAHRLRRMGARVLARNGVGVAAIRYQRNGGLVLGLTIPASTTGWVEVSGDAALIDGDGVRLLLASTFLGSATVSAIVCVLEREGGGTVQRFAAVGVGNVWSDPYLFAGLADNLIGGHRAYSDGPVEMICGASGVFKALQIYLSSNSRGGCTFGLRKNGTTVLSGTVGATGTGWFEAVGEVHVARGDRVCFYLDVHGAAGGSDNITVEWMSIEWNGGRHFHSLFGSAGIVLSSAAPSFVPIGGSVGSTTSATATEAAATVRPMLDCRPARINLHIPEGTGGAGDGSVALRVDGADALAVGFSASDEGWVENNDPAAALPVKAAQDLALRLETAGVDFYTCGITWREDINVYRQIRSRVPRPDGPRRRSRLFAAHRAIVGLLALTARTIRSRRRRRSAGRNRGGIGNVANVGSTPGTGAVARSAGAPLRRRAQIRTSYHVGGTPEYRFYHSTSGPPSETDTPFATSPTLDGLSPVDVFGDGTHYVSVSWFNGAVDSGFRPIGPNGETYRKIVILGGTEELQPPKAPSEVTLEARAGGVIRVHARYVELDTAGVAFRADTWAVAYTSNGSTPPEDSPTTTQAMTGAALEILELDIGPFFDGATIKIRVQTRASGKYSDGSEVLTILADAAGPAAPQDSDSIPG